MRTSLIICTLFLLFGTACKKDPKVETGSGSVTAPNPTQQNRVVFSFEAVVNSQTLVPSTKGYTNSALDQFTISKFSYFLSNIRFKTADGTEFKEVESYHLVKHVEGKTSFTVTGVPEGTYTSIDLLIGVDAERNKSGAQTGDLDVNNDMYWDWDQGYVFFKLEGIYLANGETQDSPYAIHVGGFEGPYNAIKPRQYTLPQPLKMEKGKTVTVRFTALIDEIFKNPKTIGINDYLVSPGDPGMKMVADNYEDMLVISKIEN